MATTTTERRPKSTWRRVGTCLANILTVAILLFLVLLALGSLQNPWYRVLVVTSTGMEPAIQPGDAIVITPGASAPGAIVTFQVGEAIVTRRVVEVRPDGGLVTQSDATAARDDWAGAHVSLLGVYRFRLPWIGQAILAGRKLFQFRTS